MAHKDAVVKANVDGVAFLMKKNKIDVHFGVGKILGHRQGEGRRGEGRRHGSRHEEHRYCHWLATPAASRASMSISMKRPS